MRLIRFAALALVPAPALSGPMPAHSAEPYRLRIAWVVASGDLATLMFAKPGLAPHANIDLPHKLGFLRASVDVKKHADLTITKEAAQRH